MPCDKNDDDSDGHDDGHGSSCRDSGDGSDFDVGTTATTDSVNTPLPPSLLHPSIFWRNVSRMSCDVKTMIMMIMMMVMVVVVVIVEMVVTLMKARPQPQTASTPPPPPLHSQPLHILAQRLQDVL